MSVDGPANCHVDNVSSDEPSNHEDAEGNVTSGAVAEIFEQFCGLLVSALVVYGRPQLDERLTGSIMSTKSMVHIMTSPTRMW
jgi:hypothetical protein